MIRVRTGNRLHFGLAPVFGPPAARLFGGIGMMIDRPGLVVEVRTSPNWTASGPLAERALSFARSFAAALPASASRPLELCVKNAAPEHVGLGAGTQLALAVARAISREYGFPYAIQRAAIVLGRGRRTFVGVQGFASGGFIYDAGNAIAARIDFPDLWRIVVVLPPDQQGVHGDSETRAFESLSSRPWPADLAARLLRLIHQNIISALRDSRLDEFGEALHEFNSMVGDFFAPVQSGRYASSIVADIVKFIRDAGVRGVGQSSWGPTVFAVTEHQDAAETLAASIVHDWGLPLGAITICKGLNRGATIELNDAD